MWVVDVERAAEQLELIRDAAVAGQLDQLQTGLAALTRLRAMLAGAEAVIVRRLVDVTTFPERAIADGCRGSLGDAGKLRDRAAALDSMPVLAGLLADGSTTAAHVDAVTRACTPLEPDQRRQLMARADEFAHAATIDSLRQFRDRVGHAAKAVQRDGGLARFDRQRRATRARSWTDAEGMWCLSARFDPLTGVELAQRWDAAVNALFAESTPEHCPSDPAAKHEFLRAHALARLLTGSDLPASLAASGRAGFLVVVEAGNSAATAPVASPADDPNTGHAGLVADWGIPVEIPERVLHQLLAEAQQHGRVETVVVRNGIVLHAPGATDLGRTTRLASRAQRQALHALYRSCAVPGCSTHIRHCKLHHIVWWRHGGATDLANLLPVCARHHQLIHQHGWQVALGPHRELTIRLPDGQVLSTGPPSRIAA